jgi:N6-L-threonylcarbamoyladenine synthase
MIFAIETSCDETGVSLVSGSLHEDNTLSFKTHASLIYSQAHLHKEFGGVFPTVAKREHISKIAPLITSLFDHYGLEKVDHADSTNRYCTASERIIIEKWLQHESTLVDSLIELANRYNPSTIDAIAVTVGPGLEPALWVGINTARTLALLWKKPLIPINHMEGHVMSGLWEGGQIEFPLLSVLVSGGHTELVLSEQPFSYTILGATRDDAAGEAFDKGARLLGLPYPGGAQLSRLAQIHREHYLHVKPQPIFPRPMIHSQDLDFSFSGLKTALLYHLKDTGYYEHADSLPPLVLQEICRAYEDAIIDVIIAKTKKSIDKSNPNTIVVAGGVSANAVLQKQMLSLGDECGVKMLFPKEGLTGDNAEMIGMTGALYFQAQHPLYNLETLEQITAQSSLRIDSNHTFF